MTVDGARIEARDFSWCYAGRSHRSPATVNFSVSAGEKVLVVGPSGVGKSTLFHALAGLGYPTAGSQTQVSVQGQLLIDALPAQQRRTVVGLMQQDPETGIVLARVGDDVAFGPENLAVPVQEIWPRVRQSLDAVGLDVPWDRDTGALSGGQQQRLSLAAVAAMEPRVLLLDEPTANMDPDGVRTVRDAVVSVAERTGATVMIIEHRIDVWVDVVDRVIVLGSQGVEHDGSPAQIFGDSSIRSSLVNRGVWVPGAAVGRFFPAGAPGEPLLEVRGLEVGREHPVAQAVDFSFCRGTVTAVTGVNGAGKSTLALTLAGLLAPVSGSVRAVGSLARGVSPEPQMWSGRELVTRVGVVFQEPEHQFLTATVRAELAEGPRRAGWDPERIRHRVEELLQRLGLSEVANANPFTLSGGQKRRLSVGTVLAAAPDVVVLDEPTFGQDPRTWQAMVALLAEQAHQGRAVVVLTHDQNLVEALGAQQLRIEPITSRSSSGQSEGETLSRAGVLARRDAFIKVLCALLVTIVVVVSVDPVTSGLIVVGEVAALALVGQSPARLLRGIWPIVVAALLSGWATVLLAEHSGAMVYEYGPLTVSEGSLWAGLAIVLRGLALALPGIVVVLTTDPTDVADGLAISARVPARFVIAALAGLRLVTLMLRQWQVMVMARRARGTGGSLAHPWVGLREMWGRCFGLLVHALRRATRLAVTMEVRGFSAGITAQERTWARPIRRTWADALLMLSTVLLCGVALCVSWSLGVQEFIWE